MKKYLLTFLCLLALRLQANPNDSSEPIGERFGMSLLQVIDSIHEEGTYHYTGCANKYHTSPGPVQVDFQNAGGTQLLTYSFVNDKCDLAMLMLPLTDLDSIVRLYDQKFISIGQQMWRTPYGRIKVAVVIGAESMRSDHKPHLRVIFDHL